MLSNSWTFRATSQSAPRIFTVAVAVPQNRMLLVVTVAAACVTITLPAADLYMLSCHGLEPGASHGDQHGKVTWAYGQWHQQSAARLVTRCHFIV